MLVVGQLNNLTLQTRMTRKPRTKNESDDFDDLWNFESWTYLERLVE